MPRRHHDPDTQDRDEWQRAPRRVARLKQAVRRIYGNECWLCRLPIDNPSEYSIDHVVPRSLGGEMWSLDNMRPAHFRCNAKRGNRNPQPVMQLPKPSRQW
jgi:5-methylcytosine-specific restriction endonuclease McrA